MSAKSWETVRVLRENSLSNRKDAATGCALRKVRLSSTAVMRVSASVYGPPEKSVARVSVSTVAPDTKVSPFSDAVTRNDDGVKSVTRTRMGSRAESRKSACSRKLYQPTAALSGILNRPSKAPKADSSIALCE